MLEVEIVNSVKKFNKFCEKNKVKNSFVNYIWWKNNFRE